MPAKTPDEILGLEYDWLAADSDGHVGLFTTAGTPAPVVRALSREVEAILATPQVRTNVRALTAAVGYEDEATFGKFLDSEFLKWKSVLATLNLAH